MRYVAYALIVLALTPFVLSVAVSFTPSRFLELPGADWTLVWYRQFFDSLAWTRSLENSLLIAVLSAAFSTAAGMGAALAFARHRFRGARIMETAILLPLFLPGTVIALGLLAFFRQTQLWGTHVGMSLAHAVLSLPVAYLVLRSALSGVKGDLESAARGLGASQWQVFRAITLPLIAPAVFVAGLFGFLISLNETTLTLFLATRDTETLPRLIWPHLRFAITPLVAAASGVLALLTVPLALLGAKWFRDPL